MEKSTTPTIVVVGLGPGDPDLLTLGTIRELRAASGQGVARSAGRVFVRTGRHPSVTWLDAAGVAYEAFARLYEESDTFEDVYAAIVERLIAEAERVSSGGDGSSSSGRSGAKSAVSIVYAVPGHPTVAEASVQRLLSHPKVMAGEVAVRVVPALSAVDAIIARLGIDPIAESVMTADAANSERLREMAADAARSGAGLLVMQVYDRMVAAEAKLTLMEVFGDEAPVFVIRSAGSDGAERVEEVPLFELDRLTWLDHLTSVYVRPRSNRRVGTGGLMEGLAAIMARLRSETGCPWDRKQTHSSLKRYLIEESYEVLDAVDSGIPAKLCEELGDVLLQVVFHAQLAAEQGDFDIADVISGISQKLVRRHPHVFGDVKVSGAEEVLVNWEAIKKEERADEVRAEETPPSVLDGIPGGLPALLLAQRMQERAARVGFDWPDVGPVWDKIQEELEELRRAIGADAANQVRDELGDVLFTVVNLARFLDVDAEEALRQTAGKFRRRFRYVEKQLATDGQSPGEAGLAVMDGFWEEAKKEEDPDPGSRPT